MRKESILVLNNNLLRGVTMIVIDYKYQPNIEELELKKETYDFFKNVCRITKVAHLVQLIDIEFFKFNPKKYKEEDFKNLIQSNFKFREDRKLIMRDITNMVLKSSLRYDLSEKVVHGLFDLYYEHEKLPYKLHPLDKLLNFN